VAELLQKKLECETNFNIDKNHLLPLVFSLLGVEKKDSIVEWFSVNWAVGSSTS